MAWLIALTSTFLLIVEFPLSTGLGTSKVSWETRYLNDLASSYNKAAPPVTAQNNKINVSLDLGILGIDDVNEEDNTVTATFIVIQSWVDLRLQFNASEYGDLDSVFVPTSLLWIPDIVPWNIAATGGGISRYGDTVYVTPSGMVFYIPIQTVTTNCNIDVSNFPNDVQTCTMWFGSWTFGADKMSVSLGFKNAREMEVDRTVLDSKHPVYEHSEWSLVGNKAKIKVETKTMDYGKWEIILITANLRRKDSFYHSLSVGTGAMLALLIPFLFLLPSGSTEKTNLGLLIIIGFTLLILVLQAAVPLKHDTTPRIGRFYVCSIVLSSLSVIISVILKNLRMRDTKTCPVPSWLKSMLLNPGVIRPYLLLEEYTSPDMPYITGINHVTKPEADQAAESKTDVILDELRMYVRYISDRMMTEETRRVSYSDWDELVRVLDRVLFLLFSFLYLTTALGLLT